MTAKEIYELALRDRRNAIKALRREVRMSRKKANFVIDFALNQDFTANGIEVVEYNLASPNLEKSG